MATKDEIKAKILPRLEARKMRELSWVDITTAIGSASQAQKDSLNEMIQDNSPIRVGAMVLELVRTQVKFTAGQAADVMLANNTLSLDEADQVL